MKKAVKSRFFYYLRGNFKRFNEKWYVSIDLFNIVLNRLKIGYFFYHNICNQSFYHPPSSRKNICLYEKKVLYLLYN